MRAAHVSGHALAPVQHLHHMGCHAQLQHLPKHGLGGVVAVTLKLDVAVCMHPYGFEEGPLPGLAFEQRVDTFWLYPFGELCKSVGIGSQPRLQPVYEASTAGNRFRRGFLSSLAFC